MKFLRTKNKEKICYINIIMPIIGYFIFVLTFVCHVQFNLIDSTTLLPTKKKRHIWEIVLLIRIWPCLKQETFPISTQLVTQHECLFTTSPSTIPPFHTPPFYPWLKSEARLTRCVEEKLHGNMADIDSLEFAIVPRDTIDEIEFHSRSFACDSAEDRHVLLAALTQRNLEIE